MNKTPGQRLYEIKSPPSLRVVPVDRRHFATAADVMTVPNPDHIPWRFLSQSYRDGWEKNAVGHHLLSEA